MAGIGGFLQHTKDNTFGGGGGQWLQWKDDKTVTIWLHTKVVPIAVWNHSFNLLDVVEDRDTKRPKPLLRFLRFVSPDPEPVHKGQKWRKDDGSLKVLPDRDPFLILREWLRWADHIGLEDTVFAWRNPKDNTLIEWSRAELSGLVQRAKANFNHSLDTRQEYLFAVVRNDDPGKGVLLSRESSLLGRRLGEVVVQQQMGLGEQGGDPLLHPYPFVWTFNPKAQPNDMYKVFKAEGVACSDEVWAAITSSDVPDVESHATTREGDMEKIREAFQASAKVELPLDQIFSEDPAERRALCVPKKAQQRPATTTAAAAPAAAPGGRPAPQRPGAPQGTQAPGNGRPEPQRPGLPAAVPANANGASRPATAAAAAPPAGVGRRRRKVEPEPPPPEPEVEMVPCDCGHPMAVTDTTCSKCGAVYEIENDPLEDAAAPSDNVCFACKGPLDAKGYCSVCKLDSGDEIPF